MRALCEGVNTGIRSSRAVNAHSFASDSLKGALEMILHRVAVRLALPAGERCAVISDDQFQSSRLVGTPAPASGRCSAPTLPKADYCH